MLCNLAAVATSGFAPSFRFPSVIFFKNSTVPGRWDEQTLHDDQVKRASNYQLAIAGWGEDSASAPACR